jgi:hypothetical protein
MEESEEEESETEESEAEDFKADKKTGCGNKFTNEAVSPSSLISANFVTQGAISSNHGKGKKEIVFRNLFQNRARFGSLMLLISSVSNKKRKCDDTNLLQTQCIKHSVVILYC